MTINRMGKKRVKRQRIIFFACRYPFHACLHGFLVLFIPFGFLNNVPADAFPDDPLLCEQWYLHNPGVDCEGNAYGLADADGTGDACDPEIDGDGFPYPVDCDDFNPRIHPYAADPCDGLDTDCDGSDGVPEVPDNGVDDDCDGKVDEGCFLRLVTF